MRIISTMNKHGMMLEIIGDNRAEHDWDSPY